MLYSTFSTADRDGRGRVSQQDESRPTSASMEKDGFHPRLRRRGRRDICRRLVAERDETQEKPSSAGTNLHSGTRRKQILGSRRLLIGSRSHTAPPVFHTATRLLEGFFLRSSLHLTPSAHHRIRECGERSSYPKTWSFGGCSSSSRMLFG